MTITNKTLSDYIYFKSVMQNLKKKFHYLTFLQPQRNVFNTPLSETGWLRRQKLSKDREDLNNKISQLNLIYFKRYK